MSIVVLPLPDVKMKSENRPREYRNCHGETFQRWGAVKKPVKDNHYRKVEVYRVSLLLLPACIPALPGKGG